MKMINQKVKIHLLIVSILVLFFSGLFYYNTISLSTVNSEVPQIEPKPKIAGYWNLTGSKILVDDSDPNYDWSNTSSTYDWCTGNGTWADPYVIENVYIDGNLNVPATPGKIHSENLISIRNSVAPFIIRNCTLLRSGPEEYDSGIYLRTVHNGIIYNNTINYCDEGVYVDWYSRNITITGNRFISDNYTIPWTIAIMVAYLSHNTTIYDNYFFDYTESVAVSQSDYVHIEKNFIVNTYMDAGVYIAYSDYGKILNNTLKYIGIGSGTGHEVSDNIVENCAFIGIHIGACSNTTLTGNKVKNCDTGIYLSSSDNNTIKNNSVINSNNKGIHLWGSNNTNIFYNNFNENTGYGVYLDSKTENNTIYLNQIFDNGIQAYDQEGNNKWNNGSIGNYYGDYSGKDIDDDGIGDIQYNITGPALSKDIFPIWWDAPVISINSPIEDQIFGTDSPDFEVAIDEGIANTIWYSLNSSTTHHIITGTTGKINQLAWDALEEGNVKIIFYINDSRGLIDSQEVNIIKQIPVEEEGIIPGYNIILVLGNLIVISILSLILKKLKISNRRK